MQTYLDLIISDSDGTTKMTEKKMREFIKVLFLF